MFWKIFSLCCIKNYHGCSFITQTHQAKLAADRNLKGACEWWNTALYVVKAGSRQRRVCDRSCVSLKHRTELDNHICVSGESDSPKARASSGVRPFFRVRLTVEREKKKKHIKWLIISRSYSNLNYWPDLMSDLIFCMHCVLVFTECGCGTEAQHSGRTWLAVGPGPSPLSGLSSASWTLGGRPHDTLHDLVCGVVSTDLSVLHSWRPRLHTATWSSRQDKCYYVTTTKTHYTELWTVVLLVDFSTWPCRELLVTLTSSSRPGSCPCPKARNAAALLFTAAEACSQHRFHVFMLCRVLRMA